MDAATIYSQLLAEIKAEEAVIAEHEANLARARASTEEKRRFAAFLSARMGSTVVDSSALIDSGDDLHDEDQSGRVTFKSMVRDVLSVIGDAEEFTATTVFDALRARGDEPPPKVRITTVLGRMAEAGELELARRGLGNQPNFYRKIQPPSAANDGVEDLF